MPVQFADGRGGKKSTGYDTRQQSIQNQREVQNYRPAPAPVQQPAPVQPTQTGQYVRPVPTQMPGPINQIQGNAPNIDAFLGGDVGYQGQLRQFGQALNDFLADVTRRRGTLETDFGISKKAGADQRIKDLDLIEDDFGARGLLTSGLYGKAVGDYETEFNQRMEELARRQQEALGGLQQEEGTFRSQQQLKEQAAKEAAIRRRAEQFGL